jgi:hypothetical protein
MPGIGLLSQPIKRGFRLNLGDSRCLIFEREPRRLGLNSASRWISTRFARVFFLTLVQ